jgi:hypothetical protein
VPAKAHVFLSLAGEYPDLSVLRLCDADELGDAVSALVPYAKGERCMPTTEACGAIDAAITVRMTAQRLLGGAITGLEYRQRISEARYDREYEKVYQQWIARLDGELTALTGRNRQLRPGTPQTSRGRPGGTFKKIRPRLTRRWHGLGCTHLNGTGKSSPSTQSPPRATGRTKEYASDKAVILGGSQIVETFHGSVCLNRKRVGDEAAGISVGLATT